MPKKTRKMKLRASERRETMQYAQPQANGGEAPAVPTREFSSRVVTPLTFDYSHIYSDLKRIALFASFFFFVLIVLSFIIK